MSSLRRLVSAVTGDDLATQEIRKIDRISRILLFATTVTVTDTLGLFIGRIEILPQGTANVAAAAVGMVDTDRDQLIFDSLVGPGVGDLRLPVDTLTTSLIYLLSVEPDAAFA